MSQSVRWRDWFRHVKLLDWSLHILNTQQGNIGFINEVMGVHRIHEGGVWSKTNPIRWAQESIRVLEHVNTELEFRHNELIGGVILEWHLRLALELARNGNLTEARNHARMCTAEYLRGRKMPTARLPTALLIAMWLGVCFPALYRVVSSEKALAFAAHRMLISSPGKRLSS